MTAKTPSLEMQKILYKVIQAPHVSEKSARLGEHRQYAFKVNVNSTKTQIKEAVQFLFNVEVTGVQTLNVEGKRKIFRGRVGHRPDWKKAYVTLKEGQSIDLMNQSAGAA